MMCPDHHTHPSYHLQRPSTTVNDIFWMSSSTSWRSCCRRSLMGMRTAPTTTWSSMVLPAEKKEEVCWAGIIRPSNSPGLAPAVLVQDLQAPHWKGPGLTSSIATARCTQITSWPSVHRPRGAAKLVSPLQPQLFHWNLSHIVSREWVATGQLKVTAAQ